MAPMTSTAPAGGFTVEDLDWLRNEPGIGGHLELDPWGCLIVTPAEDRHEIAQTDLFRQLAQQLNPRHECLFSNGLPWKVPGGSGYVNVPDLMLLPAGWERSGELGFAPPPLLVGEIGSRSTRAVDRGRKLADYRLGGAGLYLLVDLGSPTAPAARFELHDFTTDDVAITTGAASFVLGGQTIHLSLDDRR